MRAKRYVVGAVLSAITVVIPAAAASADVKDNVCNGGEVCWNNREAYSAPNGAANVLYDNNTGTDGNLSNNTYPVGGNGVNNTFSSVWNRSSNFAEGNDGANQAGDQLFCLGPNIIVNANGGASSNRTTSHQNGSIAMCS